MDHRKHFYDRYTTVQSRFTSAAEVALRIKAEHQGLEHCVAQHLPLDKSERVLDLGCGYGAFLMFMEHKGYKNLRGIDLSLEQVELATSLGLTCVEVEDLMSALCQESEVGLITMFDVIEHLTRSEAIDALQAIHSALRPGGTLVMRTPNIDARLGSVLSFGDLTHEMHLNRVSVLELFASLPFSSAQVLEVPPTGGGLLAVALRGVARPVINVADRCVHLAQGIGWSSTVSTPNMLIVAHR